MIKARPNPLSLWFYSSYFRVLQKIYFRKFSIVCDDVFAENQSVLLLQNHFSLYDGYWSMYLCHRFFKRNFYVMMLEEELKKRLFLTRCGVFSVRKNSRELLVSLHYAADLLKNPRNVVTVYPTGELISQHWQQFSFQRGFSRLANPLENQPLIAFAVILVDYFSQARPEIRVYLKNYQGERTPETVELSYREFYQNCVSKQTE